MSSTRHRAPGPPGARRGRTRVLVGVGALVLAAAVAVPLLGGDALPWVDGTPSAQGATVTPRAAATPTSTPTQTQTPEPTPTPTPSPSPTAPDFPAPPEIGPSVAAAEYSPAPQTALDDTPDSYVEGCHQLRRTAGVVPCVYGDPESATVVALVGDSHAAHWQPGLRAVAEERGWRLETYTKSACPLASGVLVWHRGNDREYDNCVSWNDDVLAHLVTEPPDVVVTSVSGEYDVVVDGTLVPTGPEADALLAAGASRSWAVLADVGVRVAVLQDTPWLAHEVGPCVTEHPDEPALCDSPAGPAIEKSGAPITVAALAAEPRATLLDLTPTMCSDEVCPAVIDGVLTMRDEHHLTSVFARGLAPWLSAGLDWAMR